MQAITIKHNPRVYAMKSSFPNEVIQRLPNVLLLIFTYKNTVTKSPGRRASGAFCEMSVNYLLGVALP